MKIGTQNSVKKVLLILAVFLVPSLATATVITTSQADENGYIISRSNGSLSAVTSSIRIIDSVGYNQVDQGIVEFDLADVIATNAQVGYSIFTLSGGSIRNSLSIPIVLDIYGYIGDGVVSISDWDAGSLLGSVAWDGLSDINFDASQFVIDILNDSAQWFGVNIRMASTDTDVGYLTFNSNNSSLPILTTDWDLGSVATIPEPSGLLLMGFGLIVLYLTRRRQLYS